MISVMRMSMREMTAKIAIAVGMTIGIIAALLPALLLLPSEIAYIIIMIIGITCGWFAPDIYDAIEEWRYERWKRKILER